jgi:hypothetical protein
MYTDILFLQLLCAHSRGESHVPKIHMPSEVSESFSRPQQLRLAQVEDLHGLAHHKRVYPNVKTVPPVLVVFKNTNGAPGA